jgi:hypothetical protein
MKNLNVLDLVYIAGFLDGDGSIMAQLVTRKDYKWGYQIQLTIQFTQLSKRRIYLEKFKDILGVGFLRDRMTLNTNISDYVITDVKHVYSVLKALQPLLRIKQKQANVLITLIEQLPLAKDSPTKFLELAQMVDHLASLNDSKNSKITSQIKKLQALCAVSRSDAS